MPLTDEQRAALAGVLAGPEYSGQDDASACALLNTPTEVPNSPAPTRYVPLSKVAILGAISDASTEKLFGISYVERLLDLIDANDRANLMVSIAALAKAGKITGPEAVTLAGLLNATETDPTWPANVPGPTPFQSIEGLGDASITNPDGSTTPGSCQPWMVTEARS